MAKCPPGFKKKGDKCVRSRTYKTPLLRQKEEMDRKKKFKEHSDRISKKIRLKRSSPKGG